MKHTLVVMKKMRITHRKKKKKRKKQKKSARKEMSHLLKKMIQNLNLHLSKWLNKYGYMYCTIYMYYLLVFRGSTSIVTCTVLYNIIYMYYLYSGDNTDCCN